MTYPLWAIKHCSHPTPSLTSENFAIATASIHLTRSLTKSNILAYRVWRLCSRNSLKSLSWSRQLAHVRSKPDVSWSAVSTSHQLPKHASAFTTHFQGTQQLWRMFCSSWGAVRPKSNTHYSTHRDFRLFFLAASPRKSFQDLVSSHKYLARWLDSYNLLFSLFTANANLLLLSHKLFIEESLVFNWGGAFRSYKLFKYAQPFFTFSDLSHGGFTQSVLNELLSHSVDASIIADIKNRSKFLFHLRRNSVPTIGLVPISYSPWSVSYPVPAFSDSKLVQLYFIRWVFSIKAAASSAHYSSVSLLDS